MWQWMLIYRTTSMYQSCVQLSIESNFAFALVLLYLVDSMIGSQSSRHFLNQWEVKPKPIVFCSHAFSRAWRRLHVFASSSDGLIVLFTSVVIGQRNYFGFGLTTLNWKPLYLIGGYLIHFRVLLVVISGPGPSSQHSQRRNKLVHVSSIR